MVFGWKFGRTRWQLITTFDCNWSSLIQGYVGWKGFATDVIEVIFGQIVENMSFLDDEVEMQVGGETPKPVKDEGCVRVERNATGAEVALESMFPPKVVAFENGNGSDEKNAALLDGIGRGIGGRFAPVVTIQKGL